MVNVAVGRLWSNWPPCVLIQMGRSYAVVGSCEWSLCWKSAAYLIKFDSLHGTWKKEVETLEDQSAFTVYGTNSEIFVCIRFHQDWLEGHGGRSGAWIHWKVPPSWETHWII